MRSFLKWWWYTVRCHYNAVQYNMILHTSLYWSRAFDLINRHMLFYKLIKAWLHGRIVDTLCNLYAKKQFRIKCNGSLSPLLETSTGVNQGGYVRSCLFRRYLADLTDFWQHQLSCVLKKKYSASTLGRWHVDGLPKQLNYFSKFCSKNLMILNEMKTVIHRSQKYQYLGKLISETQTIRRDIFRRTYEHSCNKATNALFSMNKKLSHLGVLPPKVAIHLFKSNIEPVLTYGCEVWEFHKKRCWSGWQIFTTIPKNTFESKRVHEYDHGIWRIGLYTY